jgi:hypothetical protein
MNCCCCKHYRYKEKVQRGLHETPIGECTRLEGPGNLTFAYTKDCPEFTIREHKFNRGDVFIRQEPHAVTRNHCVVMIVDIQYEYAPAIYRVRSNYNGEWSETEAKLIEKYTELYITKPVSTTQGGA